MNDYHELLNAQQNNFFALRFADNKRLVQQDDTPEEYDGKFKVDGKALYFYKQDDAIDFHSKLMADYGAAGLSQPDMELIYVGGTNKMTYWSCDL